MENKLLMRVQVTSRELVGVRVFRGEGGGSNPAKVILEQLFLKGMRIASGFHFG